VARTRPRYRFGPLERRGLIAGWRAGQIAAVAVGVVLAIAVLHRHPTLPTIAVAAVLVAMGVATAWWPIGGRTAEQWIPTVVRWGSTGLPGRRRWRSGVERRGHRIGPDGSPRLVADDGADATGLSPKARQKGPFGCLEILGFAAREADGRVAVVHDQRGRTYTVVLELLGHSFALLSGEEKERRVASWASVLSSLARERSLVHRVQWVASTVPDDGAAVGGHLEARGVLPEHAPARRSYASLLQSAGGETCRHDVHLAVQLHASGAAARAMRSLGGGPRAACALLLREVDSLRRHLASADIPVERVLDEQALATLVRRSTAGATSGSRGCSSLGITWPWPLETESEWGMLRTDGSWHATYWIAEWPRVDVGPEFLGPLLLGSVRRSVSVVMEPLGPAQAVRQAERARTADIADAELRKRGGFLATARRAREAEVAVRREEELADGHSSFRFSGYVSVSAPSRGQLAAACDATEQAASQCRLELRRLYGDQDEAFTCTLPLGRGLA
jgi:hypothetical protein